MPSCRITQCKRNAVFGALLSAFSFGSCQAADLMVTSLGDSGGSCPGSNCTLRAALATVDFGDVVTFDPGFVYPAVITLTQGELMVTNDAIVEGPGADRLTISANDQSRVLTVALGVNVKLAGLTLAHGYVLGDDGMDGIVSGFPAQDGESAKGGCIWIQGALYLERVAVRHCLARGGDGGNGAGSYEDPSFEQARGAMGGSAFGGAIAVDGQLELSQSSVTSAVAMGGNGGVGGYEWDGGDIRTQGGMGGFANGGAISVMSGGSMVAINSSVLHAGATGGSGGDGGTYNDGDSGGRGGNGGDVFGGAVYVNTEVAFVFSTFENQSVAPGPGGTGGVGSSTSGLDGSAGAIVGAVINGAGMVNMRGMAIIDRQEAEHPAVSACYDAGGGAHDIYASDPSCAADFVAPPAFVFADAIRTYHGLDELPPLPSSLAVDSVVECIDFSANESPVTSDQAGRVRPLDGDEDGLAQCDIGAVELDNDGIFTDGFDSG